MEIDIMRIYFRSLTVPKKAAKRVQASFGKPPNPMKLGQAQNLTAQMLGYASWHELTRITKAGDHRPSPLDEACSTEEQRQRIDFQTRVLLDRGGPIEPVCRQLALRFRVSAAHPFSPDLEEQTRHRNSIVFWTSPASGVSEWRFFPSERSAASVDDVDADLAGWQREEKPLAAVRDQLLARLAAQPENLYVAEALFALAEDARDPSVAEEALDQIEAAVMHAIPADFPAEGEARFEWYTPTSRLLHRVTYGLAEHYYRAEEYPKAKHWFSFTLRTCRRMNPECVAFLTDLSRDTPSGDAEAILNAIAQPHDDLSP